MLALGIRVRDKVTGFEGVIIGRYQALTGCDQYEVQPPTHENKIEHSRYFDELRLMVTDSDPVLVDPRKTVAGPVPG